MTFGRKSNSSGGNEDADIPTLLPISELLEGRPLAAPAASSGAERGRQEKKDRTGRSSSSKPSFAPVIAKTFTKSPVTDKQYEIKSKSPRSTRGSGKDSTKGSAKRSSAKMSTDEVLNQLIAGSATMGPSHDEVLDQLIAGSAMIGPDEAPDQMIVDNGIGSKNEPRPQINDRPRVSEQEETASGSNANRSVAPNSHHGGRDHENMADSGETEEPPSAGRRQRAKAICRECTENKSRISELENRLVLSGKQATHFVDQIKLLERHADEKGRECAELENRLTLSGKQAKHFVDQIALLERHVEEKEREWENSRTIDAHMTNERSNRLEESLNEAREDLRSSHNELMQARTRVENLESTLQYNNELHLKARAELEDRINAACTEDDTGRVQLTVDLHESHRVIGELQGDLSTKVRQLELIQGEMKRITDAAEANDERHKRELQVAKDVIDDREKNNERLLLENRRIGDNLKNQGNDLATSECEVRRLLDRVSQLEISNQELSQKAVSPKTDHLNTDSDVMRMKRELAQSESEIARLHSVFGERVEKLTKVGNERVVKHSQQIGVLQAEILRLQSRSENKGDAEAEKEKIPDNPKREVSVASGARSVSPGTTGVILNAIEEMNKKISSLSDRVDQSDNRSSASPNGNYPGRGRSATRRSISQGGGDPDDGGDESDDSESSSDGDYPAGNSPGDSDDPAGGSDANNVRINMNPSRGDNAVKTTTETRRIKELDTVKVPKFPTLPSLPAWKLAIGKNLVAASGRNDMREINWWAETSKETSTFDSLEDSGEDRFLSLDLKLSISLSVMLKEVNNEVTSSTAQKEHAASMKGRMLKGRQIAWLILTFFKRNPKMGVIYSVTDLAKLDWMGDKQIYKFLMMWRLMLDQMNTTLPESELTEILLQKVEKSIVLKEDVAHFYRMDDGDPSKNTNYLIRSMENHLDRERYRANRANDLHSMLSGRDARTGAPSIVMNNDETSGANKKKKKKEKKPKTADQDQVKAAPAANTAGKGAGKGKAKREKKVCYYYNQPSGCPKTAEECWFAHKKLPAAEVAKMVQPPSRAGSRASSPAGGKPNAKAKPRAKSMTAKRTPGYCYKFAQPGGCQDRNCPYMHLDEAMIEEFKRAEKVLRDNTSAKP